MTYFNANSHVGTNQLNPILLALDSVISATCSDYITLNATLIGDLTGHTFEWIQVSGTPIVWLESRFQPNVTFRQSSVRDDKVFVFTLDKGNQTEKRGEVLVTAVPTDIISTNIQSRLNGVSYQTPVIDVPSYGTLIPAVGPMGSIQINDPARAFVYVTQARLGNTGPQKIMVEQLIDGEYVELSNIIQVDTHQPCVGLLNNLTINSLYRIKITYMGAAKYSNWVSHSSDNFISTVELSITDSDTLHASIPSIPVLSTVERAGSSELTLFEFTDRLYTVVQHTTTIISNVEEKLFFTRSTVDPLLDSITTTTHQPNAISTVVEILAFQHSSLG